MSKTYRKVPTTFVDNFVNDKKVKRNDKRHQTMTLTDGVYSHPCHPIVGQNGQLSGFADMYDGAITPKYKKAIKRITSKKTRRTKIETEE